MTRHLGLHDRAVATSLGIPVEGLVHVGHAFATGHLAAWSAREGRSLDELPVEAVMCCDGAAYFGPERCTCWEPVYVDVQRLPVPPADPESLPAAAERCHDCAFRKGSPELADEALATELLALPAKGARFWCHQGMLRPAAYQHPVLGEVPADSGDWQPPQLDGIPYRLDGTPGLVCAGWAAIASRR